MNKEFDLVGIGVDDDKAHEADGIVRVVRVDGVGVGVRICVGIRAWSWSAGGEKQQRANRIVHHHHPRRGTLSARRAWRAFLGYFGVVTDQYWRDDV